MGFRNTSFFDVIKQNNKRIWNESDDEVKQTYGEQYFENDSRILEFAFNGYLNCDNPEVVVNDMIDAICNAEPKIVYRSAQGIIPTNKSLFNFIYTLLFG